MARLPRSNLSSASPTGAVARALAFAALLALLVAISATTAHARELLSPVVASTLAAPQPVTGSDGRTHLAYELQLVNRTSATVTVRRVEALAGGRVAERLTGKGLAAVMLP